LTLTGTESALSLRELGDGGESVGSSSETLFGLKGGDHGLELACRVVIRFKHFARQGGKGVAIEDVVHEHGEWRIDI